MNKQSLSLQNWKCQWFAVDTLYLEEMLHVFQGRLNTFVGFRICKQSPTPSPACPLDLRKNPLRTEAYAHSSKSQLLAT